MFQILQKPLDALHWLFWQAPQKYGSAYGIQRTSLSHFYAWLYNVFLTLYVVPWAFILIWYLVFCQRCVSDLGTRILGEWGCVAPYHVGVDVELPWYLDFWAPSTGDMVADSRADAHVTLSPRVERIMTVHVPLREISEALSKQVLKIQDTAPELLPSETDAVLPQAQTVMQTIYPLYENFSLTFCLERDIMNHALLSFVNTYAAIASRSDYIDFSWPTAIFWPLSHHLRFLNRYAGISFFPPPKIYKFQAESQARCLARRFVAGNLESLGNIESRLVALQEMETKAEENGPTIGMARGVLTRFRKSLEAKIKEYESRPWYMLIAPRSGFDTQALLRLQRVLTHAERMEHRMEIIEEVLHTTRGDILMLRQWLSSLRLISHTAMASVSNRGLVAFPPKMENLLRNDHFWVSAAWSSDDHGRGDGDRHHRHRHPPVPVNYTTYHYLLKLTNDANALWLQSQVLLLCGSDNLNNHDNSRNLAHVRIISGSLLMICELWKYELMLSSVEGDMRWGLQRNWVQEKRLAVQRIRRSMHLDADYVAQLAWDAYQMVKKGGGNGDRDIMVVLPEYMH